MIFKSIIIPMQPNGLYYGYPHTSPKPISMIVKA